MENNTVLKEMVNGFEIVGTLKQNNLKSGVTRAGNDYIGGDLVIMVKDGDVTHEHKVKVFAQMKDPEKPNKLYKAYNTVKAEYVAGMRISVRGTVDVNMFESKQSGELIVMNELNGKFISRDVDISVPDSCIATLGVYIEGYEPIVGADGFPTGKQKVKGFTVGWGEKVIPLQKAVISDELFQQFSPLYFPGSSGELNFKLNNYPEEKKAETTTSTTGGFGITQGVSMSQTFDKFVNNYEIIGGQLPYGPDKAFKAENVEYAMKKFNEQKASVKSSTPATPPPAFGTATMGAPSPQPQPTPQPAPAPQPTPSTPVQPAPSVPQPSSVDSIQDNEFPF